MSVTESESASLPPEYNTLLQAQQLRKSTAEAELAELRLQREKAQTKAVLKQQADGPPSPGVIPDTESASPPEDSAPGGGDPATPQEPVAGEAGPREGGVAVDAQAGYMATVIAYRALLRHADAVATAVDELNLSQARILLVDSLAFAKGDVPLLQLAKQLDAWQTELTRLNQAVMAALPPEQQAAAEMSPQLTLSLPALAGALVGGMQPAALLPVLAGAVSATADLIGYFKTDYAISGRTVAISDTAMQARVAGAIKSAEVYLQDFYRIADSPLINDFTAVLQARATLQQNLDLLKSQVIEPLEVQMLALGAEIDQLQTQLQRLKGDENAAERERLQDEIGKKSTQLAAATREKSGPDRLYARAIGVVAAWDQVNQSLTTVEQGQDLSPLARAALRDYVTFLGITHLLYVKVVSAGGEIVTGKNWFLGAPKVGYLAGGALTFVLAAADGAIVAADTFVGTDYLKYSLGQDVLS